MNTTLQIPKQTNITSGYEVKIYILMLLIPKTYITAAIIDKMSEKYMYNHV